MKADKTIYRYLFHFPHNTYNNENPLYEIIPISNSDIQKGYMFAGRIQLTRTLRDRETFLYLEASAPLSEANIYKNLYLLCYLLKLATGLPATPESVDIADLDSFSTVFKKYQADLFFEKHINYGGLINDKNPIMRIPVYTKYLNKLPQKDLQKFENALQTYIWAEEIQHMPNPHLRYTLYMTLFLSSIDQLADNPRPLCSSPLVCPDCKQTLNTKHSTSHAKEIENLIRKLLTGSEVNSTIQKIKKSYNDLRSKFLHDGLLVGGERDGGFFAPAIPGENLVEDMANLTLLNRKLLELFLQNNYLINENQVQKQPHPKSKSRF